jgi:putative ABC transport system permease protein
VTHAGVSVGAPFMANYAVGIQVTGMDSLPQLAGGGPYLFTVGGGALEALGVRLRSGRLFNEMDDRRGAAPVAVITERTARLLWPDADPLGRCLTVTDVAGCAAVVGVVADLHRQGLREPPFMALFLPLAAVAPDRPPQIILVRTAGPPDGLVESLRRSLLALRPDLPYVHIQPYEELIANQARSWRLGAIVFIAFGVLSLAIAAIGVYGVLSFTVARRMPELGIRAALGATSRTVLRMVVGGGVATAVAGVALGSTLGLVLSGRIQGLLFETSGREPAVFLVAGATIVTLALAASLAPGIRAARADPLAVLRAE